MYEVDRPKLADEASEERALAPRGGRPKGSKNKITLLKLMTEEVVRTQNADRMKQVCDDIINDALAGDRDCRKLVWQAVMSKSGFDQNTPTGAVPEIIIRSDKPPEIRHITIMDAEVSEIKTEEEDTNG